MDNRQLDESRIEQSTDGFELEIKNVQYDDKGQYECRGSNPQTRSPQTVTFTLAVECKFMLGLFLDKYSSHISILFQWSTTSITKAVVCANRPVGLCIYKISIS